MIDESKFMDILMENKPEDMMEFLLEHGKKPKAICPIFFFTKETDNDKEIST